MNAEVAREMFENNYRNEMTYERFISLLEKGLKLAQNHPVTDRVYVSRVFQHEDIKAINLALAYNQEVMLKLLLQ